jgi:Tol biopolymer transport system component/DNA-binding winged helix-turn-helix (wHTH) protein
LLGYRLDNPYRPYRNYAFGPFELHCRSRELYKHGVKLKLRPQPLRVLSELLRRPGELVTREELRDELWSAETFVDFEQSLNTSIKELRAVLGDSAAEPRYVETVPRLGYRFIAKAEVIEASAGNGNSAHRHTTVNAGFAEVPGRTNGGWSQPEIDADLQPPEENNQSEESETVPPVRARWRPGRTLKVFAAGGVLLVAGLALFLWLSPPPVPRALRITQLTHFGHVVSAGGITMDGARLFFLRREPDRNRLMQVSVSGGESQPFLPGFENWIVLDLARDHSEFLVKRFPSTSPWEEEFWLLPFVGGSLRRLSNLSGDDAIFSPDGREIVYTKVDGIYACDRNGSNAHKLVSLPSISWAPAWSPDGRVLRFTLEDTKNSDVSLWEISSDGSNLHPLFPERKAHQRDCCGKWSADGRNFFFTSNRGDPNVGVGSVWAQREKRSALQWSKPGLPVRLTAAPMSFGYLRPSPEGTRLFVSGIAHEQNELLRAAPDKKSLSPIFNSTDVHAASLSPSADWLAVILGDWTLWRSRPDGTERTQLSADFAGYVDVPRWSPDGHWIVFQGRRDGHPSNIYKVSADGGPTQELLPNDQRHETPDWSPDGESVVYSVPREGNADGKEESGLFILNLKSGKTVRIPQSEDIADPQLSSDGRYLVGLIEAEKSSVVAFDFQTRRWKAVARGNNFYRLRKSPDGRYFYFQNILSAGEPLFRMHDGDWKVERVMSFEAILKGDVVRCRFTGMMQDGSPLVIAVRGGYEIYSIDLDLP